MNVNASGNERTVAIVLHDVSPGSWAACRRLARCVDSIAPALPKTWLVVPHFHGEMPTSPWIRGLDQVLARGDELALHGWLHVDEGLPTGWLDRLKRRWYTAGEGEFAGLDAVEAARRLAAGMSWFADNGWPLHGFVAPAWLMSDGARFALARGGLDYTCTLTHFSAWQMTREGSPRSPRETTSVPSLALVYSTRAAWRRRLSCLWNGAIAWQQRHMDLLRFELHPADVEHRSVRRSWMSLLEKALLDREPVTLSEAARRLVARERPVRAQSPTAHASAFRYRET